MDATKLTAYLEISEREMTLADAKTAFSRIVAEVHRGEPPVIVSVYNKPQAVISDLAEYRDLLERAEAYDTLVAHQEADAGAKLTFDEVASRLRAYASKRKSQRQSDEASAALGG